MTESIWVIVGVFVTAVSAIAAVLTIALNHGNVKKEDERNHETRHQLHEQKIALLEAEVNSFKQLIAAKLDALTNMIEEVKDAIKEIKK